MDYKRLFWEHHHYRFGLAGEGQADVIEEILESRRGSVLNLGSGPWGDKLSNLAPHCDNLIGADIEVRALEMAMPNVTLPNVKLVAADCQRLPFPRCTFDYVLALGLFGYIENPVSALLEIGRVCRPAGRVLITNAVVHPLEQLREAGSHARLQVLGEHEGYCPAASGTEKRRYLLVFGARGPAAWGSRLI